MKSLSPISLVFCLAVFANSAFSQNFYIPDPNFRAFLQSEYPSCMNGDSLDTQCAELLATTQEGFANQGIQDFTGIEYFVNVWNLNISHNPVSVWPIIPSSVQFLVANDCDFASIPSLSQGLTTLICSGNPLTTLPDLPPNLLELICANCQLIELPELPSSLSYLGCPGNQLSALPELSQTNLGVLHCSDNLIEELPTIPSSLTVLHCDGNLLDSIPEVLNTNLSSLKCSRNSIYDIPDLPSTLQTLYCSVNLLETLPQLPLALTDLRCDSNMLSELPELPPALDYLDCSYNELNELPSLPSLLASLKCGNNNLDCVPILPDNLWEFEYDGNNILCVPNIPWFLAANGFPIPTCGINNANDCNWFRTVMGKVYADSDNDCQLSSSELGLANRVIEAGNGFAAISDSNGYYELFLDTGSYTLVQHSPNSYWYENCPYVPYNLTISTTDDTIPDIDFPNQTLDNCHWLWVDVNSSLQRPCFTTNSYVVSYCNYGTEGAEDVYVDLTFPPEVIPLSSSIPWQQMGGGVYRFEVGDLPIDACGSFNITDSVSCDATVGSTVCVTAEIFPVSPCLIATAQPGWDNSSIEVAGSCNGTDIEFLVENVGSGDMTASTDYRIYQDNALLEYGQLASLMSGASVIMSQPADGATYRLEVDQSVGHPGVSLPRATVEGCASSVSFGQVLVSQQNDVDDHIEVSCTELTASYDPNDKRVVPSGYGSSHLVHPEDSLLEYTIRFQNTGSDTAFTVEVVDTLPSEYLNPITFLSGASSHLYTVRMHGNGIVTWRFENILLPDSATNEAGSQGFVKFKIRTRPNLPNGTVINNRANIYFDFNAAIVTETCFITISDVEIIASNSEIAIDEKVEIYPNPTTGVLNIRLSDNRLKATGVSVVDITGREVLRRPFAQQLDVSELSAGNYILSVYTDKGVLREKVVVQ